MNTCHKLTNKIIADILVLLANHDLDGSNITDTQEKQKAYANMREAILHFVVVNGR